MVASGLSRTKHTKFLWSSEKQGVEDFQNAFAQSHCAVEAKRFLPPGWPERTKKEFTLCAARSKQTTNND
jgi:hypothetical protein